MLKFRENEEAVSPVIGVILMVAITVILAAVIAAFVFGMAGDMDSQKEVYATAKYGQVSGDGDTKDPALIVTLQGGRDIDLIDKIECLVEGQELKDGGKPVPFTGLEKADNIELGKSGSVTFKALNDNFTALAENTEYTFVVRATFKDGSRKVIVETTQKFPTLS
ncbi:type IV pilin [Methanoculleus bourgensis]|uniref:type IV pilin n=1 Tax=Methanoculleus bourgensis TaxID=83986 RepID=UPI003B926BE6